MQDEKGRRGEEEKKNVTEFFGSQKKKIDMGRIRGKKEGERGKPGPRVSEERREQV